MKIMLLGCVLVAEVAFAAPTFTLPNRIFAAPGLECNVYYSNVFDSSVPQAYAFQTYSKKGKSYRERWCWTPGKEDAGKDVEIVVNAWNDDGLVAACTTTVVVAKEPVDRTRKFVLSTFAASASNGGYPQYMMDDMREAGFSGYKMIGTRHMPGRKGTDVAYYDGYGGYTCTAFLTQYKVSEAEYDNVQDAAEREQLRSLGLPVKIVKAWQQDLLRSPLVQFRNGKKVVDVAAWLQKVNGGEPADLVVISLGLNSIFNLKGEVPALRERIRTKLMPTYGQLADALKAVMPKAKFALTTQTVGCGQDGFAANYGAGWNETQHRKILVAFNREIEAYAEAHRADGFVGCIPIHHGIDPVNSYHLVPVPASARSNTKVERFNNAVHFGADGSRQVGDMLAAWLQCNWDNL